MQDYRIPHNSEASVTAHWLPCAAKGESGKKIHSAKQDHFNNSFPKDPSGLTATFRGRELQGMQVMPPFFSGRLAGATGFGRLVLWGHDDSPFRSDSVPQAFSLIRMQQELGQMEVTVEQIEKELVVLEEHRSKCGA